MKATLDTNAVINLCDSNDDTDRITEYLKNNPNDSIYVLAKTTDELKKLSADQQVNLDKLNRAINRDAQRYFTIGESTVGGDDPIRGDSAAHDGIQTEVVDITGAYARYKEMQIRNGNPVKNVEDWLKQNNHQSDAVLYERATELGCDYFVSNDARLKRVLPASNSCKPVTLQEFLALI